MIDLLNRAIMGQDLVSYVLGPKVSLKQGLNEMSVNTDELSRQDSSSVDIRRKGFKGFVVSKNLRGWGSGHRRN